MRIGVSICCGLLLASLPFMLYGSGSYRHAAHLDHAPRHGGMLYMVGDYHLELVEDAQHVEVWLSDASRKPRPAAGGSLTIGDGTQAELAWDGLRLVADLPEEQPIRRLVVETYDGTELELDFSGTPEPAQP